LREKWTFTLSPIVLVVLGKISRTLTPINQNRTLKKIASLRGIKKCDILECFESSGVGFKEGDILRNITGYVARTCKLTKDL
jgi:hypothetical protein